MSIKYKLVEKANPQKRTEKKWYANVLNQGSIAQRDIAKNIAGRSSLTVGDVANVIENLLEEMPKILTEGKSVRLGEFGSFRISISSEGAETQEKFNAGLIKKAKIVFTPGTALKKSLEFTLRKRINELTFFIIH